MWISDCRLVLADRVVPHGSVRIENGLIAEIAETAVADADLAAAGLTLMPGFIDMHGDMVEREIEPRPNVRMPMELGLRDLDRRLAVAGVTTAYAALSFSPSSTYGHLRSYEHTSAVIRAIKGMADRLLVDHKVHARFEITFPKALEVIEQLIAEGAVDLISLNDHTPGQGQYRDIERHVEKLARDKGISLEEAAHTIAQRIEERTQPADVLTQTLDAISAACHANGIVIASHDDDTVGKVELMHSLGVSISEFPVTEEAAAAARRLGLHTAMGAPNALRGQSYSGNLSAREAHAAGLLDILAADYHPSAILPAVLELAKGDAQGLAGACRLATLNPARALGLDDRGEIALGKRADLVIADDTGIGHVRSVFRAGRVIYSDGSLPVARAA